MEELLNLPQHISSPPNLPQHISSPANLPQHMSSPLNLPQNISSPPILVGFVLPNLSFSVTTSTWPLGTLHSITSLLAAATYAIEYRMSWEIYTPYAGTAGRNCTLCFLMLYPPVNNIHYEYWKSIIFGENIGCFTPHRHSIYLKEQKWPVKLIFSQKLIDFQYS